MSRVITFSTKFPGYHPKAGQPTEFVEKIWESLYPDIVGWSGFAELSRQFNIGLNNIYVPKHHTIRAGCRWKVGDKFSPRVWSGRPYNSPQIIIGPDIMVKKVFDFCIDPLGGEYRMDGRELSYDNMKEIARNDGFDDLDDLELWFNIKRSSPGFRGQIICWNEQLDYVTGRICA